MHIREKEIREKDIREKPMHPSSPVSRPPSSRQKEDPSLAQTLAVVLSSYLVFLAALRLFAGSLSLVGGSVGDNPSYLEAATAIRHWQISGIVVKQFWGLSYAIAALSAVTGLPGRAALVVVCITASLVSVILCHRLFGGWIAIFFALLSFEWFQRSLLGGAEPLFMALILASFLALRRAHWAWSAVFGALATVVRPFGVFALIGTGVQLLRQKKFRQSLLTTAIGLAIGALYAWPLAHYLGSPFANVAMYQRNDWHGRPPFILPFLAILRDTFPINAPLTNLALTWAWILFVLLGLVVALRTGAFASYAADYPAEICFVSLYCLALYTYSAPGWARGDFPRFAIPMLPWTLVFLRRYLPARRWAVAALTLVSPTLAAASAVGIRNVAEILSRHR